jgi:hypothetical protein
MMHTSAAALGCEGLLVVVGMPSHSCCCSRRCLWGVLLLLLQHLLLLLLLVVQLVAGMPVMLLVPAGHPLSTLYSQSHPMAVAAAAAAAAAGGGGGAIAGNKSQASRQLLLTTHLVILIQSCNVVLEGVCHPSVADPHIRHPLQCVPALCANCCIQQLVEVLPVAENDMATHVKQKAFWGGSSAGEASRLWCLQYSTANIRSA